MNISITPELEKFVHAKVASGMYQSASELFREALRLLAERDAIHKKRLEKLNQEIQIGLDQVKRGELISSDELKKNMEIFKQQFFSKKND